MARKRGVKKTKGKSAKGLRGKIYVPRDMPNHNAGVLHPQVMRAKLPPISGPGVFRRWPHMHTAGLVGTRDLPVYT